MTLDVFFYESFDAEARAIRERLGPDVRAQFCEHTIQSSGHTLPPAPVVSIRTQSRIPAHWRRTLQGVLSRSTGHDHLHDLSRGPDPVPAGYLPQYCSRAVAEHAAMLWMALLRRLPAQLRSMATFARTGLTGGECSGRTLLVAGVGNIGSRIVDLGRALGMDVIGFDREPRLPELEYTTLRDGLERAHVIACAMSLNAESRGILCSDALQHCRTGAVFVNVARGELSPLADLCRALEAGRLGGVGLDVYEDEGAIAAWLRDGAAEPAQTGRWYRRLAAHPNALLTPHNAFNTAEALARKAEQTARQARAFLEQGAFVWPVPAGH